MAGNKKKKMSIPWTHFWDMHSGGGQKEKFHDCFIQAPEKEAKVVFYKRFGHNPERVTCTCCGEDYSISVSATLSQATGYKRGCLWKGGKIKKYVEKPDPKAFSFHPYTKLVDYRKREDVCIIPSSLIKPEEKVGDIPQEGYVWQ